jgi:uncharacterized protein (TIGR02231 family)
MKTSAIAVLFFSIFFASVIDAAELKVSPEPSKIKVFLRGAQLEYEFSKKIEKGEHLLIISGLANNIEENSINLSAKGDLVVLSTSKKYDFLNNGEIDAPTKKLYDSLKILKHNFELNKNESEAYSAELDLLKANQKIGNEKTGTTVLELQKMGEFFRKRIIEIKSELLKLTESRQKIQKDIDRIQKQINEINTIQSKPVSQIVVQIIAKKGTNAEFKLSYFTFDAGWNPAYDIFAESVNSPVKFNYRAELWQKSGINWEKGEIILSTRNPNVNNQKPILSPWFIDFERFEIMKRGEMSLSPMLQQKAMSVQADNVVEDAETFADYIEVNNTQLSIEFVPKIKITIPSDGKKHSVLLQEYSINAEYKYYAAPKLDNNAFLTAKLSKWTELNLLPGNANIFFENSFVGKTYINPSITSDTLTISLGRDQNIIVDKIVMKDFTEDKFLSSDVERIFAYEIKVKNNKKDKISLTIEDQLPISSNDDITVKQIDISGGKVNQETKIITWEVDVEAGKSASKKMIYSVRYPKGSRINGL